MYHPDGIASSEFVTPAFLQTEYFRMVEVIIHEIWHVQGRLPLHFEESTSVFIGRAGASIFWYDSKDKALERLEIWLKFAEAINLCHAQISDLATQLHDGKINLNEYLLERENCIKAANKSQTRVNNLTPMMVVHFHTYAHYFPLVYRLYDAMDRDLIRLVHALREISEHNEFQDPVERDPKIWFQKVRETENEIEAYVENLIQKAIADKKERK
ncbi:MAG: hypothetical protein COT61_01420 [Candidatus Portnoybacteria bacterium CG09_land_8_20_14_0_10_44_13]|uniref:Uncharacterized protein n=3 Tax=Candidatus Portnoyibacteriota TaxID=1817913 RepID=A0A2H0WW66_9BACT|nr:MAG: hypothetical protein AUK17_01615 [Parcubacteria group bacterium CG2_30_44_18]PIS16914.1 MAG: hypothetical protein COT61_01420 [Candidatus Portnoybacteria bacterium CG09_land_8_20_14_0_10_44_13]PIZ71396.1 MAG: hypothetical protein COY11_01475 [Candidatus Portnoybacteria bacterium CG_4_10_14_0_2_um_filter_44_20]PJA63404.1 MAG: hypothetical protein CO161_01225 [Candidatus Portnoybacteria bacterium CG_4_9_14_3_um_filter_44_9]